MMRLHNLNCWSRMFVLPLMIFSFAYQGCSSMRSDSHLNSDQLVGEEAAKVSEFILGAGDRIEIVVYRNDDLRRTVQIDHSGKIMYPLVGDIQASGLNLFQLRDKIHEGLSPYILDPQISASVVSIQSQKIIVLGEVKNPGFFQAETPMTVLEAVSRAGGFTLDGKQESVLLIRGGMKDPKLVRLDIRKALQEGDLTQNVTLQRGDIVYVPRTFIADVDSFFTHLSTIISPIVTLETGYFIGQQIDGTRGGASVTTP